MTPNMEIAESRLQQLPRCLAAHEWPHLELEDALLNGAGDDEARHVDGLELPQPMDSIRRLLLDRRVPPACRPPAEACFQMAHTMCASPGLPRISETSPGHALTHDAAEY